MADYLREEDRLRFYSADEAVITLEDSTDRYKVVHLRTTKDGSFFVQVPYFPESTGVLSAIELDPAGPRTTTLELDRAGKSTSHLVKLAHHTDGEAHFSQDHKVYTQLRRRAFRLDTGSGPLFQVDIVGPTSLERFSAKDEKKKRATLRFRFDKALPAAVSIGAEWEKKQTLLSDPDLASGSIGPVVAVRDRHTGQFLQVVLFGQPAGHALQDYILVLRSGETIVPEGTKTPHMFLMGGLDWPGGTSQPGLRPTGLLAFMYPVEDSQELARKIGSIDFTPPSSLAQGKD